MTEAALIIILCLYALIRISYATRAHNDPRLAVILVGAALSRIAMGFINHFYGPLPGARIDAVMFDQTARNMALTVGGPVDFTVQMGPLGYSSLLSIFYMIAGYHYIIPTFVNLIFVVEFLILVYIMTREWGGERAAQLALLFCAFYPTALIYTSVPLREAPLLWGLAVFVRCLFRYAMGQASLYSWKLWGTFIFMVWLHDGIALAIFLIPIALWFRNRDLSIRRRLSILGVSLIAFVLILGLSITIFDFNKLPADPMKLFDVEWLARMREVKAAYGVGYGEVAPSWGGIIRTSPLVVYAFVAAPFPFWGEGVGDLPKMAEGILSLALTAGAIVGVWITRRRPGHNRRMMFLVMFLYLITVFAMGTGNSGIAARHRAKFVWMPIVLNAVVLYRAKADEPPGP